jgi:A/G-specific adenine glycosylase
VLLSEILLQQTTVVSGIPYFHKFTALWPTLQAIQNATLDEILHAFQGLGYYRRAHNFYKTLQYLKTHNMDLPENEIELLKLPGIGPYTSAAIASIAFNQDTVPVDGNVKRVFSRLVRLNIPPESLKGEIQNALKAILIQGKTRYFAEALMDLGATICRPRNPLCHACPIQEYCGAFEQGDASSYPKRETKIEQPQKYGIMYWIQNEKGEVLLEKRPDKGLLSGLIGLPTSEWLVDQKALPQLPSSYVQLNQEVNHTFTHFKLNLKLACTISKEEQKDERGFFEHPQNFHLHAFPSVMKKAIKSFLNSGFV